MRIKKGFTIVELMIAMTLVSILMLAIIMLTIQIADIVGKGAVLRELNTAGRTINDDFTRAIGSSKNLDWNTGNSRRLNTSGVDANTNSTFVVDGSGSGAFCTGEYSYLWNDASVLNPAISGVAGSVVPIRYSGAPANDTSIRLVRVSDRTRQYCTGDSPTWTNIPRDSASSKTVLAPSEHDLMIYGMRFSTNNNIQDEHSGQTLVNISYIIGTKNDRNQVSSLSCDPTSSERNRCAINKFELLVRASGR